MTSIHLQPGDMNYIAVSALFVIGFVGIILSANLIKKLIALTVFQSSILLLFVSLGKSDGGTAPIYVEVPEQLYVNPLPHVLMLTAIVVGVAVNAVGLALAIKIKEHYGTLREDEILAEDNAFYQEERRLDVYK